MKNQELCVKIKIYFVFDILKFEGTFISNSDAEIFKKRHITRKHSRT